MEEIKAFKCKTCGAIFQRDRDAFECEFKHSQNELANRLLEDGYTLGHIDWCCKLGWNLTAEQKDITKDNCFIVSHWQCCDKPAYQIVATENGMLRLCGCGNWSGYYGNTVSLDRLPAPHPKEELFIDGRYPLR